MNWLEISIIVQIAHSLTHWLLSPLDWILISRFQAKMDPMSSWIFWPLDISKEPVQLQFEDVTAVTITILMNSREKPPLLICHITSHPQNISIHIIACSGGAVRWVWCLVCKSPVADWPIESCNHSASGESYTLKSELQLERIISQKPASPVASSLVHNLGCLQVMSSNCSSMGYI